MRRGRGSGQRWRLDGRGLRRRCFARGLFLLRYCYRRTDVLDVLEHKHGIFLGVLELLKQKQWLFIIAKASFDTIPCKSKLKNKPCFSED